MKENIENMFKVRMNAIIGVTYRCNFKCHHCGTSCFEMNEAKELTTDEIKNIIDQLQDFNVQKVTFFGGEPTLREDLFEIIKYTSDKGYRVRVNTNGFLMNKDYVRKLKESGLRDISLSIDSAKPEVHDKFRGKKGAFKKTLEIIKYSREVGIPKITIFTYATHKNIKNGDLKAVCELSRELKVDMVRIIAPLLTGRWIKNEEQELTDEEKEKVLELLEPGFIVSEIAKDKDGIHKGCWALKKHRFYISPYGELQPCWVIPYSFANLREMSLKEAFKKMWCSKAFKLSHRECLMDNKDVRKDAVPIRKDGMPLEAASVIGL